ncbi:MAG: hypothetical protein Q9169_003327 [Polycauliona sp. 2 TL-2023]
MSGAEALIVLGIIANTVGVIDFAGKALGRIKDAGENAQNIPKAFRDIQVTLPLLSLALKETEKRIKSGALDGEACSALEPVLNECFSGIKELKEIFDQCLPKDGSSRLQRGWKAVISLRRDKKVEEISGLMQKRLPLLTYHHLTTPTTSAVVSISAGITAMQVTDSQHPKVYSMVPVQWAEDFTGREEQMDILTSKLSQPGKHVRVAVFGLGGIGKTRFARQYIETQKVPHTSVFWIHAGIAERMRNGCREIAKEIGIPGCDSPDVDISKSVKEWFESEKSGRWLLIYDNVDDILLTYGESKDRLAAYFPRSNHGSILMTTRNRQIGVKFATSKNVISLPALTEAESITLMTTKLGDDDPVNNLELKRLTDVLGGIPLAITQAISFIEENGCTPTRYLELYEANDSSRIDLLSQNFEDDTRDSELQNPIASTWVVTFEYIKQHQPLAANTLCLMSMFDSQAIPEGLISETAGGDCDTSIHLERTLGILQAYSLTSPRYETSSSAPHEQLERTFDLHRLVRLVTRNRLAMSSTYDVWIAKAINVMSQRCDEIDLLVLDSKVRAKLQYLPHAMILMSSAPLYLRDDDEVFLPEIFQGQTLQNDHTEDGKICPTCTGNILVLAFMVQELSMTQIARMLKKAVFICTFALGANHDLTLKQRSREAYMLNPFRDNVKAGMAFQQILRGSELVLGPEHRKTLERGLEYASSESIQGRYGHTEQLLLRLNQTSCNAYGQEDPMTVDIMLALSNNSLDQGRCEEARQWNAKLSQLANTTSAKIRLAQCYKRLSQYSDAEHLYLTLLDNEDVLRQDAYLDRVWRALARVYYQQRLFSKAEGLQRQVLEYRQQVYGENSVVSAFKAFSPLISLHLATYDTCFSATGQLLP